MLKKLTVNRFLHHINLKLKRKGFWKTPADKQKVLPQTQANNALSQNIRKYCEIRKISFLLSRKNN